jgi:hypothetical protein
MSPETTLVICKFELGILGNEVSASGFVPSHMFYLSSISLVASYALSIFC